MADLVRIKENVAKMASMNAPEADIDGYIASEGVSLEAVRDFNPEPIKPQPLPQQSAFMGRMEADFNRRKAEVADAEGKLASGEINPVSKAYRVVGANLGMAGDYVGNVVGSGARYAGDAAKAVAGAVLPDDVSIAFAESAGFGKDASKQAAGAVADTMVGRGIKNAAQWGAKEWQDFAQANPEMAGNIQATGSYFNAIPMAQGAKVAVKATPEIIAAIPDAAVGAAKIGADVVKIAAKPVVAVGKGVSNRVAGFNAAAGDDLKAIVKAQGNETTKAYQAVDKTGTVLGGDNTNNLLSRIDAKLQEVDLDPEFQPKTMAALRVLRNNIDSENGGVGQISLGKLDQFRRLLGRAVSPEDKMAAAGLRNILDDHLYKIREADLVGGTRDSITALNAARATAAKGFAVEKIAKIIQKADGDDNAIRKGFTKFIQDENNLRGMSTDEIAAFKNAATNSGAQEIEKFIGRFGIDTKGGVLPTLAAGTTAGAGAIAVPAAAPLLAVGTAAKYTRKLAARGDAQKALDAVINRPALDPKVAGMRARVDRANMTDKEALQRAFEAKKAQAKKGKK